MKFQNTQRILAVLVLVTNLVFQLINMGLTHGLYFLDVKIILLFSLVLVLVNYGRARFVLILIVVYQIFLGLYFMFFGSQISGPQGIYWLEPIPFEYLVTEIGKLLINFKILIHLSLHFIFLILLMIKDKKVDEVVID